ncbi:MAG: tetratricopeptide repeat protein, partial [Muribaculaceae bacterium]|nr:tetratricopeptide repeat protein [Muribaculaceae bacterium]
PNRTEIALNYADALASMADSADNMEAVRVYDRIATVEGRSPQLSSRKVTVMLHMADTAGVLNELSALLAATPNSAQSRVFAGTVYSALGRGADAIRYFNEACEVDSTSGMAYYARANYYKETGDMKRYDSEVFQALKQESLDLETKMQLLTGYVRQQYADSTQQPRIEELFRVLIDQNPHDAEIRDLFSSYYYAIKNYSGAAEQIRYAIDIDPADEQRWRMLMGLYGQLKQWDDAVATGERAMHYHPASPMLMLVTGVDYGMLHNYDKGLDMLKQALTAIGNTDANMQADVLTSLGDMYHQAEMPDSAFVYYGRALAVDPGNLSALNNYAYYLACEGKDLDKAQRMIARVIAAKPSDPTSLDTYAWVMFRQKDYAKAKEFIDLALANDQDPGEEILHHAGDIYFMAGDPDKAVEMWERALKINPADELLKRKVTNRAYYYN